LYNFFLPGLVEAELTKNKMAFKIIDNRDLVVEKIMVSEKKSKNLIFSSIFP